MEICFLCNVRSFSWYTRLQKTDESIPGHLVFSHTIHESSLSGGPEMNISLME